MNEFMRKWNGCENICRSEYVLKKKQKFVRNSRFLLILFKILFVCLFFLHWSLYLLVFIFGVLAAWYIITLKRFLYNEKHIGMGKWVWYSENISANYETVHVTHACNNKNCLVWFNPVCCLSYTCSLDTLRLLINPRNIYFNTKHEKKKKMDPNRQ